MKKVKKSHFKSLPDRKEVRLLVERLYDTLLPTVPRTPLSTKKDTMRLQSSLQKLISSALQHGTIAGSKTAKMLTKNIVESFDHVHELLREDIRAALRGDPAALTEENVIASYPGLYAISIFRVAHELHLRGIPILPRQMTEVTHGATGIDIHPGATIGEGFFIDHGTGVVIGETTIIGKNVRLYQGVTLGAGTDPMKAGRTKRHPTLEDDVICYANSSILGPVTIGKGARVGAGSSVFEDVPQNTVVLMPRPQLIQRTRSIQ